MAGILALYKKLNGGQVPWIFPFLFGGAGLAELYLALYLSTSLSIYINSDYAEFTGKNFLFKDVKWKAPLDEYEGVFAKVEIHKNNSRPLY